MTTKWGRTPYRSTSHRPTSWHQVGKLDLAICGPRLDVLTYRSTRPTGRHCTNCFRILARAANR